MSKYTSISIKQSSRPHFEQVKQSLAEEKGEDVSNDDVIRELARVYQRKRATDGGRRYGGPIPEGE